MGNAIKFHFIDVENVGNKHLRGLNIPNTDICFAATNNTAAVKICREKGLSVLTGYAAFSNAADFILSAKLGEVLYQVNEQRVQHFTEILLYTGDRSLQQTFAHLCLHSGVKFQCSTRIPLRDQVMLLMKRPMTFKELSICLKNIENKQLLLTFNSLICDRQLKRVSDKVWMVNC